MMGLLPIGLMSCSEDKEKNPIIYGGSSNADPLAAVQEAWDKIENELDDRQAALVLMTTPGAPELNATALQQAVDATLPGTTKVWGLTSAYQVVFGTEPDATIGIFTPEGLLPSGVGFMALAYKDMKAGIGSMAPESADVKILDTKENGQTVIKAAIADAGMTEQDKPKVVFIVSCSSTPLFEILKGITEVVGSDVPVIGGRSAGIHSFLAGFQYEYQFTRSRASEDDLVVAVAYGDFKVASYWGYGHDEYPEKSGVLGNVVSTANGARIGTIDDRPCAEVYAEWLDNNELITTAYENAMAEDVNKGFGAEIWTRNAFKVSEGDTGAFITISATQTTPDGTCATCCSTVEEGATASLLSVTAAGANGIFGKMIDQARRSENMAKDDVAGAFLVACESLLAGYPEFGSQVLGPIQSNIGADKPILGFLGSSEVGYTKEHGARHLSFSAAATVFSK